MKQILNCFAKVLHALIACAITILVSCKEEPVPIAVSSITLDSTSMTLIEGETQTLTATISPSNAENQKVLWSSNNSSVASVKDGVVSAIPGKALERPSSTRLEARFPYHGSGAMTRSPSPLAWRPDFPGAPREAH